MTSSSPNSSSGVVVHQERAILPAEPRKHSLGNSQGVNKIGNYKYIHIGTPKQCTDMWPQQEADQADTEGMQCLCKSRAGSPEAVFAAICGLSAEKQGASGADRSHRWKTIRGGGPPPTPAPEESVHGDVRRW